MSQRSFQSRRHQRGFSMLEALVAAGILAVVISAWLITSSVVTQKKLDLEQMAMTQTSVLSLRDLLSINTSCLAVFSSAPVIPPTSLPTSQTLALAESYVGAWSKNVSLEIHDLMNVATLKSGRRLIYGEVHMTSLNDNRTHFVGPLYLEVNAAGVTQSCYSELSSKDRCHRQDGRYLEQTGQCELPQYACASGQFMVSAGVQKWVCK